MLSNEQLLKSYILNELYFLEKDNLLNEGAIWDWVKKQSSNVKNYFTRKDEIEKVKNLLEDPRNSKEKKEIYRKINNDLNSSSLKRMSSPVVALLIAASIVNMFPGDKNPIETATKNTDQIINTAVEISKNVGSGQGLWHGDSYENYDDKSYKSSSLKSKKPSYKFVSKNTIYLDSIKRNWSDDKPEISRELTPEETRVYLGVLEQTGSRIKAEKALFDLLSNKKSENFFETFNKNSEDKSFLDEEGEIKKDTVKKFTDFLFEPSKEYEPSSNVRDYRKRIQVVVDEIKKQEKSLENIDTPEARKQKESLYELNKNIFNYSVAIDVISGSVNEDPEIIQQLWDIMKPEEKTEMLGDMLDHSDFDVFKN